MKSILGLIIGILTILSMAFGAYFYFEHRYALAQELAQLKQSTEYQFKAMQLDRIQERIWKLEDRHEETGKAMDVSTKEEIRQLKEKRDQIKTELGRIEKK